LAHRVSSQLLARHGSLFTQEFHKADRGGRVFLDTGRNRPGAPFASGFSVRARAGAPGSAARTWGEIGRGAAGPHTLSLRTRAARIATVGDLWSALVTAKRPRRTAARRR